MCIYVCIYVDIYISIYVYVDIYIYMYGGGLVAKLCPTLVTPWTARLLCPWGFLGKNARVGCHFLLQYISIH